MNEPTPQNGDASHGSSVPGKVPAHLQGKGIFANDHELTQDERLLKRALSKEWPISRRKRRRIMARLYAIASARETDDKTVIEATGAVARLDAINERRETASRESGGGTTVNVNVGLAIAPLRQELLSHVEHLDYCGDDSSDGDTGEVRSNGKPGPVANGSAPPKIEPGNNGHYHGNGRH